MERTSLISQHNETKSSTSSGPTSGSANQRQKPDSLCEALTQSRTECQRLKLLLFSNDRNNSVGLAVGAFDLYLARLQAGQVIHFSDWLRLANFFSGGRAKR